MCGSYREPPCEFAPDGHRWDRVPGVALTGDAAHVTTPNGEGANLAIFDDAELGQAIAANPDDVEAALTEYEQAMFTRAAESAAKAAEFDKKISAEDNDPAQTLIDAFTALTEN